MILVLARVGDETGRPFVEEFPGASALFTCLDLADHPLSLSCPGFAASTLTVGGRRLAVGEIRGVVNLLPWIEPDTLISYDPEEREYQAAECSALVAFFLDGLACRVVNRPTSLSLHGPVANPVGWLHLAGAERIPLAPLRLRSDAMTESRTVEDEETIDVLCVGGSVVAPSGTAADAYTAQLAQRSGLDYLKAHYWHRDGRDVRFVHAETVPDVRDEIVRRELIRLLSP